jgi:hypothetical protein
MTQDQLINDDDTPSEDQSSVDNFNIDGIGAGGSGITSIAMEAPRATPTTTRSPKAKPHGHENRDGKVKRPQHGLGNGAKDVHHEIKKAKKDLQPVQDAPNLQRDPAP